MEKRNAGLDIFRIMCCIGVLNYHVFDDILNTGGLYAKGIFFASSFCVPGFFLLSGYLLEGRKSVSIEYCEKKIFSTLAKLFGWIIFITIIHFISTGEIYDILRQFTLGIASEGILPVSWFLFTYCIIMIFASALFFFSKKFPLPFLAAVVILMVLLAFGMGDSLEKSKPQSTWLHLYLGYFILGMAVHKVVLWINQKISKKVQISGLVTVFVISLAVYAYAVLTAKKDWAPEHYYGKWYYTTWLVSLFGVIEKTTLNKGLQRITMKLSSNTFFVYLGHLSILLAMTAFMPVTSVWMAILYVAVLFVSLELGAEIFRKIPLLKYLV